ncbi:MAG: hypothetical protein AAF234_15960 [Pseudomonadota bacterium]
MIEAPVVLPWPTKTFAAGMVRARLRDISLRAASPLTGYSHPTSPIDSRWVIDVSLARMNDDQWEEIEAFFLSLRGESKFFRVHDPRRLYPKGVAAGIHFGNKRGNAVDEAWSDGTNFDDETGWTDASSSASIASSAAMGATHVLLSGLVPDQLIAVNKNDRIGLHVSSGRGLMYAAVKSARSDPQGRALVEIAPALRMGVTAGERANFVYVSSVFTIQGDKALENTPGGTTSIGNTGFTLTEVPEAVLAAKGLPV